VPQLKQALSAGSSISPKEIGNIFSLDVADTSFWELGIKRFKHFVAELEKIVGK
jgi:oligoendopeptidase F